MHVFVLLTACSVPRTHMSDMIMLFISSINFAEVLSTRGLIKSNDERWMLRQSNESQGTWRWLRFVGQWRRIRGKRNHSWGELLPESVGPLPVACMTNLWRPNELTLAAINKLHAICGMFPATRTTLRTLLSPSPLLCSKPPPTTRRHCRQLQFP